MCASPDATLSTAAGCGLGTAEEGPHGLDQPPRGYYSRRPIGQLRAGNVRGRGTPWVRGVRRGADLGSGPTAWTGTREPHPARRRSRPTRTRLDDLRGHVPLDRKDEAADLAVRGLVVVVLRSAGAAAGGTDAVAGLLEDALDDAAEGEHDDHDQGRDAGDEQAVLDRGRAALVHLGQAGVEHDAEVVQHFRFSYRKGDEVSGDLRAEGRGPPLTMMSSGAPKRIPRSIRPE